MADATGRGTYQFVTAQASVGTDAALLVAARQSRRTIRIRNTHATQVLYVGAAIGVATTTGYRILAVTGELELQTTAAIYAVASGASTTCDYIETYD